MTKRPVRLLMTRPEGANTRFLKLLSDTARARAQVIKSPLLMIQGVPAEMPHQTGYIAVFTSGRALPFAPQGDGRQAFCVGERTTDVASEAGWQARCAGRCAEELVERIAGLPAGNPIYHFCGRHHRGAVVEKLQAAGHEAQRVVVYDQHLVPLSDAARGALETGDPLVVPLFSPRTAAHFASFLREGMVVLPVVMSPAVAAALPPRLQEASLVSAEPTARAMAVETEKAILSAGPG